MVSLLKILSEFNGNHKCFFRIISQHIILVGYSLADPAVDAINDPVLKSITTSRNIVNLFNEQSKYITADEFKEFFQKWDKFRSSYSSTANELADEMKMLLENALISYFMATQRVYEWCGLIVHRLESYFHIGLSANATKAAIEMQQHTIIEILEQGSKKMAVAQEKLNRASENFNKAHESITALVAQLKADFNRQSDFLNKRVERVLKAEQIKPCTNRYCNNFAFRLEKLTQQILYKLNKIKKFYEKLKNALKMANTKIDETKGKLQHEIIVIDDVKSQALGTLNAIDDTNDIKKFDKTFQREIKNVLEELIEESRQYRQQHNYQKEYFFSCINKDMKN